MGRGQAELLRPDHLAVDLNLGFFSAFQVQGDRFSGPIGGHLDGALIGGQPDQHGITVEVLGADVLPVVVPQARLVGAAGQLDGVGVFPALLNCSLAELPGSGDAHHIIFADHYNLRTERRHRLLERLIIRKQLRELFLGDIARKVDLFCGDNRLFKGILGRLRSLAVFLARLGSVLEGARLLAQRVEQIGCKALFRRQKFIGRRVQRFDRLAQSALIGERLLRIRDGRQIPVIRRLRILSKIIAYLTGRFLRQHFGLGNTLGEGEQRLNIDHIGVVNRGIQLGDRHEIVVGALDFNVPSVGVDRDFGGDALAVVQSIVAHDRVAPGLAVAAHVKVDLDAVDSRMVRVRPRILAVGDRHRFDREILSGILIQTEGNPVGQRFCSIPLAVPQGHRVAIDRLAGAVSVAAAAAGFHCKPALRQRHNGVFSRGRGLAASHAELDFADRHADRIIIGNFVMLG